MLTKTIGVIDKKIIHAEAMKFVCREIASETINAELAELSHQDYLYWVGEHKNWVALKLEIIKLYGGIK